VFELKKLSPDALDAARQKAAQYRLLNHPFLAESICRDILAVKLDDEETLVMLCLALWIVYERMAFSRLRRGGRAAGQVAYDWFMKAMERFEVAAEIRPAGNDDAILRWNTCARVVNLRSSVHAGHETTGPLMLE
jgi:hypothetical protein